MDCRLRVEFSWSPVPDAIAYRFRVSNSSVFSKVLKDEVVRAKYAICLVRSGRGYVLLGRQLH